MANNHNLTPADIQRYQQRAPRAGYWLGVLPTHPFIHGPAVHGQQIPPQPIHQQNPPPYFGLPPPYHLQGLPLPPYFAPGYPPPIGQPHAPVEQYPQQFAQTPNMAPVPAPQRCRSIMNHNILHNT